MSRIKKLPTEWAMEIYKAAYDAYAAPLPKDDLYTEETVMEATEQVLMALLDRVGMKRLLKALAEVGNGY